VRIGVGSYDCYHWFAGFHQYATQHLPDVLLQLVVVGDAPASRLAEGAVDLVLAPGQPEGFAVSQFLFTDELVLLTRPDHPATGHEWVGPEVAAGEVFLTYNSNPTPGFEFERFLRPADVAPRAVLVIEQTGAIAEMVASGLGLAILSRWAVSPWLESGKLAAVRCGREGLDLQWNAMRRAGAPDDSIEAQAAQLLATFLGSPALSAV
jgi:LysR family transcriptional regulator for metE and metH